MLRLLAVLLLGYGTYRITKEFIDRVPDDFEPVPLLPSPERQKHDAHVARVDRLRLKKRAAR